jgi:NLR family CARD domain-containing protein 3
MTSSDSGECRTNVFRQNLQIAEPLDTGDDTKEKTTTANATESNEKHNWIKRILKQNGPWNPTEDTLSYKGAPSIPMPVEVSDPESLAPFFAHLRNNGTHQVSNPAAADLKGESGAEPYYNVDYIEFEKGVLYSDGRIDLCKMVTGPRNIGDLMERLAGGTGVSTISIH